MRNILRLSAALLLAAALVPQAAAQAKKLEVIVFPGGHNWPIWAAQDSGAFARNGIEVNVTPTPGSQFQLTNLHAGKFHIGMTAIDNVIAYMEGQGPAPLDNPDFFAFMGGDNRFLALTTVPEITTVAGLKGKELSVDALSTGYAFVLRDILDRNGIGGDVKYVAAGGVRERFAALMDKKHGGTLTVTPFDILAQAKGFNVVARAADSLGAYQGLVGAAKRSWAKDNEAALVGYIRAYREGLAWLFAPANKAAAIALLRKQITTVDDKMGEAIYGAMLGDKGGMSRDAAIDMAGVRTVLQLRAKYAEPKKDLGAPEKYIDLTYFQKATQK